MKSLVRNIVILVAMIVLFLSSLGFLLWHSHMGFSQHSQYGNDFLGPSQIYVAKARHAVAMLETGLYSDTLAGRPATPVPFRFRIVGALDEIEDHLARVVRLASIVDYKNAFDLPSRAFKQYETARAGMFKSDELSTQELVKKLALFEPLLNTLDQLAHTYALEEQRWLKERERLTDHYFRLIVIGVGLLVVVLVPLIGRVSKGLQHSVRRELRIRQELEEANQNLAEMAIYDSLTKLGNRHLFKSRLEQVIGSANRSGRLSALIYIDLDNFKRINDSLGHDAGDQVLTLVAARLVECVRSSDTVARLGGDEFTVIVTDMDNNVDAATVASKILRKIKMPMTVAGTEFVVSASIGITILPTDGNDAAVLMKNADLALYKAKENGRDNFQFFVEAMNRVAVAQMAMENNLRSAISGEEFALHYQPQVDLSTGKVTHIEALLRWPRVNGQMIPPAEFIPVADATGLLKKIGGWVLTQACRDLSRLRRSGSPDLRISVNLSPGQFRDPTLLTVVEEALRTSRVPPRALEIEITESMLIADIDSTVNILNAFRDLGITVAIDDFGVGYSSLSYLKSLPIDALKIDQSFVRDIETDEADRSIVNAVLSLARSFSLRSVAEGIENERQLEYLFSQGCDEGQGFFLSRPVPVDELSMSDISRIWPLKYAPREHAKLQAVE